jgi:Bacterial Ig-like domain
VRRRLSEFVLAGLFLVAATSVASAAWGGGGNGQAGARATTVDAGGTPSATLSGRTVELTWPAVTLSNGVAVTSYLVRRYDWTGVVEQTIASGTCAVPAATTSCSETDVPAGTWTYSVTPAFGPWRGPESAKTSVTVGAPSLTLSPTRVKSTTTLSGSIANFRDAETLRFRLDDASGAELAGTVNGSPTPVPVPTGGAASVTVTIPAGTSEGPHTVYAVASPSGESASVAVTVDDTPPPAPTITSNVAANSSSTSATFSFTDAEAGVSFSCRLDGGGFSTCASPTTYTGLADGSHTFEAKARDAAGNEATASFTWTVDTTAPTAAVTFPASGAIYNTSTYNAGCGTAATGDFCGTAADSGGAGVSSVEVSIRRGTGNYWNGSSFSSGSELFFAATGTTSWSYVFAGANFPADGSYTIRARTTDAAGNIGTSAASTFTISADTTAPPTPEITSAPATTTKSTGASFSFTDTEAGVTFECELDGGGFSACSSPRSYSALADGSHTFSVRAVDAAGNRSASTAHTWTVNSTMVCSAPGSQTVTANADTYIEEGSNNNFGTNADIRVVGSVDDKKARGLVRLSLPSVPSGCEVTSAALRLYASSAAGGRTLQAYRAASSWAETSVTWAGPGLRGTAVTTSSGTGWRQWTVTDHVILQYSGTNNGFVIKDAAETSGDRVTQVFNSRERGSNRPELIVTFG